MFSLLQRHILKECFARKKEKIKRGVFVTFYNQTKLGSGPKKKIKDQVDAVTKSLERLIDKGMLIGYGVRTRKKWFIREVKLTRPGIRKYVQWLESRQAQLPFK